MELETNKSDDFETKNVTNVAQRHSRNTPINSPGILKYAQRLGF